MIKESEGNMSLVEKIMRYEQGEMSEDEVLELFQQLINDGSVWLLQGHYGRMAHSLIEAGMVEPKAVKK
jgi:hypothetical protein